METNYKNHQEVVERVYNLKYDAQTAKDGEKAKIIAELKSIKHFHLGLSGVADAALIELGEAEQIDVYKMKSMQIRKRNTGKVVLQIAIVAVLFAIFANPHEAWYWSFAKAIGLYVAVGFAIFLTGGLKYFKKGARK